MATATSDVTVPRASDVQQRVAARLSRGLAGVVVATLAAMVTVSTVFADATPVQLVLLYLPNVSNTSTQAASGIAELVMPEGEVRITAADLPHLDGDKQYVAWVVNSDTNEFQRIGNFNSAQTTSAVHYENVLQDAIPNKHWNLLLVTVEDNADATHPGAHHSIAGVFPRVDSEPLPGVLPNTGGLPDGAAGTARKADWLPMAGLAALTGALGFGAGFGTGRRRRPGVR